MFRNGDDGGYQGAGGFDVSGFGNNETPQADNKGFKRTEHIFPVTSRQVVGSPDTGFKIGNVDVDTQMVKIMGIIKKIEKSSVKVTYTLEDNSGIVDGIQWLDADNDDNHVIPVVENTYAAMIGTIRNKNAQHNKRHIMIFQIFPITNLNEVTAHTLQIIYMTLKSEDLAQQTPFPAKKHEMSSTYGGIDTNMGSSVSEYAAGFNLNPQQQRVLKAVAQNCQSEEGANITDVMNSLTVKMPRKEVEKILEFLASEGHVYSTSDDQHYKATDNLN